MKKLIVFLIVGLIAQSVYAQVSFADLENNKVVYPSPTAASLGKYGEYPVNLYNGLVNIGQDIVTVKSGRLSLNVSLSYHASGNKPSDIPGWVGLGFSLNAGGVITRIVRDLPDDELGGFYTSNTDGQYLWNNFPRSQFIEGYFNGTTDPRSDVYQFNFCGKTGEFVFDWNRKIHFKQQVPFKIEEQPALGGGFGGFLITTDDGTVYTFNQTERTRTGSVTTGGSPITSWYLTKIENLSGDVIVLKYTAPLNKFRYKQYYTTKEVTGDLVSGGGPPGTTYGLLQIGKTYNYNSSNDEVVYLDEIDFADGSLAFGKSKRLDPVYIPVGIDPINAEEKKLDLITLRDNNSNLIKQWKLEYFENSEERLKLKNLIVQGSDQSDVQRYSFEYNPSRLPLPLPGPNPNLNPYLTNDVDYWGYYNDALNGDKQIPLMYIDEIHNFLGQADRAVRPLMVQCEILKKIIYPTGGYTAFEYESNDYGTEGPSIASYAKVFSPSVETYPFLYNRDDGGFEQDPATISFMLTEPTRIQYHYSCGADGPAHAWATPGTMYEYDVQMPAGTYTLEGLLHTDQLLTSANSDITKATGWINVYRAIYDENVNNKTGPGLRIKSIVSNDGITSTTRSFEYKIQNSIVSSGFLSVFPAYYIGLHRLASNLFGTMSTSEPLNDVTEGAPIGYSRVVERFQDNSSIEHMYTTYSDHPDEQNTFLDTYPDGGLAHMTSNDFWRGLETQTSYYDANGSIQKIISRTYEVLPQSITDIPAIDVKPTISFTTTGENGTNQPNSVNATLVSLYIIKSCFLYNSGTVEQTFDKNLGDPVVVSIETHYDNVKHLQPTRVHTTNSDESVTTTITSYPDDFTSGVPFIDYMQSHHLTSFPVEQVVYKQKGQDVNILRGNIITYKSEGAGLPDKLLKMETASPVPQIVFKFSNSATGALPPLAQAAQYSPDAHYKDEEVFTSYDAKGNLLELTKRDGIKRAYLWGYNHEFPVAEITGADLATTSGLINQGVLDNPLSDQSLRDELNKLRGISGALVTTFTFKPLVGVTSVTDPRGKTTFYEYDNFQRLKLVRDQDGNILSKSDYKYQGQ